MPVVDEKVKDALDQIKKARLSDLNLLLNVAEAAINVVMWELEDHGDGRIMSPQLGKARQRLRDIVLKRKQGEDS